MSALVSLALPLALALPIFGALFVAGMPANDRVTLRHVGMAASIASGLALLLALVADDRAPLLLRFAGTELSFSCAGARLPAAIAIAFATPIALRAGAPRAALRAKPYTVLVLLVEVASLVALLSTRATHGIVALTTASVATAFVVALFGGPHKGSAALRRAVVVVTADTLALAALLLRDVGLVDALFAAALVLPVLVRAGVFPLGSIISDTIAQGTVTVVTLERALLLPAAATWWAVHQDGGLPQDLARFVVGAVFGGVLLAMCNTLIERDLRRFVADAALVADGLPLIVLFTAGDSATPIALAALALAGGATSSLSFAVDAMERRFSTSDSVELVGTGDQLPGLFRIFALTMVTATPLPGLGAGALSPSMLVIASGSLATLADKAGAPPNAALFVVVGLALAVACTGIAASVHLRRIVSPARGPMRTPPPFGLAHAARLWFPALLLVVLGALAAGRLAPTPTTRAGPVDAAHGPGALDDGAHARGGLDDAPPDDAALDDAAHDGDQGGGGEGG